MIILGVMVMGFLLMVNVSSLSNLVGLSDFSEGVVCVPQKGRVCCVFRKTEGRQSKDASYE